MREVPVGQLLVTADIEGAKGDRLALCQLHDAAVVVGLRGCIRQVRAGHEIELGAEQADAFGARACERGQVGHELGVHVQRDGGARFVGGRKFAD